MAKKPKAEEHENHERWLVSYADFITLLFAFFVVMYASSRVDTNKLVQVENSMRWALNFKGQGGVTKVPIFKGPPTEGGCVAQMGPASPKQSLRPEVIDALKKKLERSLRPFLMPKEPSDSKVSIEVENGKLKVRLSASKFFDPASAALRPEVLAVLDAIADQLVELPYGIRVEGHTDDAKISGKFRNNWDLSAARAATVVSYLEQAHHIEPKRLSALGLAATQPLVPHDSPEHREKNRRIDISLEIDPASPLNAAEPK